MQLSYTPKKIVIYSLGLIGGSLGLAFKNSGFTGTIAAVSSERNLEIGKKIGCIDIGYTYSDLQDALTGADLLILCSPIEAIIETIDKLSTLKLPDGLLITDVGSTKQKIMDAAQVALPSHVRFIGGHPMAGSEKSGPGASDPYLFQNAIYVLTPPDGKPSKIHNDFAQFLEHFLGCRHIILDPGVHDQIAATVSHVPHLLAVALVLVADQIESSIHGTLSLAAGGFRDMTRIASAPYDIWRDILFSNREAIIPVMDMMIDHLKSMKSSLIEGDLQKEFDRAQQVRLGIPLASKGFIGRLSEVLVVAKDQPGVITDISKTLSAHNINIKDIEVLKVREGEGGTIRLAFESTAVAGEAIRLLTSIGFTARERS